MKNELRDLRDLLLKLPAVDRAALAHELLLSLGEGPEVSPEAVAAELDRRADALDSGADPGRTLEQVRARWMEAFPG